MEKDIREPEAIMLLEKLEDAAYSDRFYFGQQNAGHIGVSIGATDGTESDIGNLTGRHPAIVGIDTLSLTGYEGNRDDLIKVVKNLSRQGIIITLSAHMPNFSLGGEDFYDYSPNYTEGNVGERILPGGDLNAKYIRFLDMIADFAIECIDISGNRIPMIFRPFHEDSGSWFWWGEDFLSPDKFKELFRYTIDYLRDERGIRNFLYAYSPNGMIDSPEAYMRKYPGDRYVDIMGMDVYNDRPKKRDGFFKKTIASMKNIASCAMDHGKICAITEIGLRTLDSASDGGYYEGLAPSGNRVKDWYTDLLGYLKAEGSDLMCAYLLTWSNFSPTQFWVPYRTSEFEHEMCGDFIKFASDPAVVMGPAIDSSGLMT